LTIKCFVGTETKCSSLARSELTRFHGSDNGTAKLRIDGQKQEEHSNNSISEPVTPTPVVTAQNNIPVITAATIPAVSSIYLVSQYPPVTVHGDS
jgi:hypothetical protein